jgi:hypothetical protein
MPVMRSLRMLLRNESLQIKRISCSSATFIRVITSRRMRLAGHTACMNDQRNIHKICGGKFKMKSPLWIPRCTWKDNTKMNLTQME